MHYCKTEITLGTLTLRESEYSIGDGISIKDRKSTYPTEDVSSSFFERVIVIIDTCLVVSKLQDDNVKNNVSSKNQHPPDWNV